MSNYTDPNQVYETGSDDTFWNSKVIRVGERFNVQVFDADGDRRPDREDSFADQALAIAFADKSVQRYSGREVGISRFDSSKPFMVGMLEFAEIADAVDAAAAASRLKENAFSAQICQALQKGVYGYQGSSVAIAYFKHGRDLDELAADEDGVPDFDRRSKAFRPRNLSNYTDPNQVYETASDDTFWNSKVIRVGERFNVQVFDADGDRRPDREDSFADQALAIAFADKSVQRYSGREVAERIVPANSLVEYRMLLDRWRTADGTAKSSGITDSIRAAAVAEVEAVAEALRLSPFGLDEKGRVAERKMLKRMESNERYVVVRLCVANQIQYLGRVSSLKEFEEYRECCGFEKSDIAVQDWKPAG